jgi:ElaB/YqjD/DUF883 family membrane-anchored ribosome-binding protein
MQAGMPQGGSSQTGQGVTETLRETASEIGSRVGDAWERTRQGVREGARAVADRAQNFWSDARDLVRRRPMAALGIAFGLGCLVGCYLAAGMRYSTEDIADRMSRGSA